MSVRTPAEEEIWEKILAKAEHPCDVWYRDEITGGPKIGQTQGPRKDGLISVSGKSFPVSQVYPSAQAALSSPKSEPV